ncbi:putative LRR receptor-like serine/threonine-protein kinase RKF3 [Camellia lanceoleosa]|nr:putative LRR receptor-like serine/threonine-protein kinase RKF3 [Camellia lanceoleosa]
MNITTRDEFEGNISKSALDDAVKVCNQSLGNSSSCASCTASLSSLQPSNLNGRSIGNLSDCTAYPSIYAAAFINRFGPTDEAFGMNSINESTTLVRYTFDEIREATKNFSRLNIIGRGGYGNVYKRVLPDGSEVALKRFKNCSVVGDAIFAHKVEVITSVRHMNLVPLRGYCTATTPLEGHQRIIVCDLMKNGSLHDHLFEFEKTFLKIYESERDGNGVSSHKMKAKETTHHFLRKYTVLDIDELRTLEGIMDILIITKPISEYILTRGGGADILMSSINIENEPIPDEEEPNDNAMPPNEQPHYWTDYLAVEQEQYNQRVQWEQQMANQFNTLG